MPPEFRLKLENKKKDSTKVTYRIQRGTQPHPPRTTWRMTLWRLEWFPRLKTWRLIETRRSHKPDGRGWWEQITHAEFGDIDEASACELALPTALLKELE